MVDDPRIMINDMQEVQGFGDNHATCHRYLFGDMQSFINIYCDMQSVLEIYLVTWEVP